MIDGKLSANKDEDPEPICPVIETCVHHIKEKEYKSTCINGVHSWGNCSYLPTSERSRYRRKYLRKPKEWEKKEIAEAL